MLQHAAQFCDKGVPVIQYYITKNIAIRQLFYFDTSCAYSYYLLNSLSGKQRHRNL